MQEWVAIRRKVDGLYFVGGGRYASAPKFIPLSRAQLIVRVDLGSDLAEFEFPSRESLAVGRT